MTFEEWMRELPICVAERYAGRRWVVKELMNIAWDVAYKQGQPDVADLIRTCVPGGSICDPQQVADAIRDYFGVRDD